MLLDRNSNMIDIYSKFWRYGVSSAWTVASFLGRLLVWKFRTLLLLCYIYHRYGPSNFDILKELMMASKDNVGSGMEEIKVPGIMWLINYACGIPSQITLKSPPFEVLFAWKGGAPHASHSYQILKHILKATFPCVAGYVHAKTFKWGFVLILFLSTCQRCQSFTCDWVKKSIPV